MNNRKVLAVLLIAPHQDDESIGCGGLLAKLKSTGHTTHVQHIYGGYTNVMAENKGDAAHIRLSEAQECSRILGFNLLDNFGFQDRGYAGIGLIIDSLIELFHRIQPDVVLCPHSNENDYEHQAVYQACKESLWLSKIARFKNYGTHNRKPSVLLCYEVWTPIQHPTLYIDISEYIDLKEKAINAHSSQVSGTNWAKGAQGLNAYRGTTLKGAGYFEAFETQQLTSEQVSILSTLLTL
ncbi:MAG: PIG-L family deacetylase [Prevotellaceae bacterium]|jgi:LmbE family N-acetylglucosaminyl deacetylase|nr:PIG-L family deacetylase [Prevotellaceae bacterium]